MLGDKQKSSYVWGMNKLPLQKRVQILAMLCEGSSMRSISRVCDVSINTVTKLLEDAGEACLALHDEKVRGVHADTKLMVSYFVGDRSGDSAMILMDDLQGRLSNRVQLTTDGHKAYLDAVDTAFGGEIDYGIIEKIYGTDPNAPKGRYSPPVCTGAKKRVEQGNPDQAHISTSYVERSNLSIRMQNRRFTRLTNAFSKKLDNHIHALALYFAFYNFVRIHKTLRVTPAMAAGIADRLWTLEDIAELVEARAPKPGPRGPYKKRGVPQGYQKT